MATFLSSVSDDQADYECEPDSFYDARNSIRGHHQQHGQNREMVSAAYREVAHKLIHIAFIEIEQSSGKPATRIKGTGLMLSDTRLTTTFV